jgi:tetratricopeptide (TPR) repeat protein
MNSRRRQAWWFIIFLAAAFAVYTYVQYRENQKRLEVAQTHVRPRNVYLITASGLRPDHLSSYLYQPIQTPAIDFLAYDGVRFDHSFTTSPESLPAHLSLLTGLYPFRKQVRDTLDQQFGFAATHQSSAEKDLRTLPGLLQKRGYNTVAFLSDPELRFPAFFLRYFESVFFGDKPLYPWQESYSIASACTIASDWIKTHRAQPHFVWLNFDEPTAPFEPPSPYDRHYANHPYDGEVAALDEQIALFMNLLKSAGVFQQSIVILTSPYGEKIESGGSRLGSLDAGTLRIPLIIAAPGLLPAQKGYAAQVSLVDVFPTIVSLLESTLKADLDGIPLFEKGTQKEITREYVLGETVLPQWFGFPPAFFVRTGRESYTTSQAVDSGIPADRLELLKQVLRKQGLPVETVGPQALIAESGPLLGNILQLARAKKPGMALDLLQTAVSKNSLTPFMLQLMGDLADAAADTQKAIEYYSAAYKKSVNPELLPKLMRMHVKTGDFKQAEQLKQRFLNEQPEPYSYYTDTTIGIVCFFEGKYEDALQSLSDAIEKNPRYSEAYLYRGTTYQQVREVEKALSDYKKAIELDPEQPLAYRRLANLLMETPQRLSAIPYLRKLLDLDPADERMGLQLARLHYEAGNSTQGKKLLAEIIIKTKDPVIKNEAKKLLANPPNYK